MMTSDNKRLLPVIVLGIAAIGAQAFMPASSSRGWLKIVLICSMGLMHLVGPVRSRAQLLVATITAFIGILAGLHDIWAAAPEAISAALIGGTLLAAALLAVSPPRASD